jgi:hypothetical protein
VVVVAPRIRRESGAVRRATIISGRAFFCLATDSNAIGYAMHCSRSHDAVIHVYDAAGNVTETHEHKGDFKEW